MNFFAKYVLTMFSDPTQFLFILVIFRCFSWKIFCIFKFYWFYSFWVWLRKCNWYSSS